MAVVDLILIVQGNVFDYEGFSALPLDRLDLYRTTVFPRMVLHQDRLLGHMDYLNVQRFGKTYDQAGWAERREMYNIWNLPGMVGFHLGNLLAARGFNTVIINNIDSEWDRFEAVYAESSRPPLVGVSSTFFLVWNDIARIAKRLRAHDPDMEIAVGGAFASGLSEADMPRAEKNMRKYGVRHLLTGFHSETDLLALLERRRAGSPTRDVPNLCSLEGGAGQPRFHAGESRWNKPVLDALPANWNRDRYPFLKRTVQLRTSTGCPFSCAFCSYPVISRSWDLLSLDALRAHLDAISAMGGVEQVIFIDDTFNIPPKRFKDVLRLLCRYEFGWYSFIRVQFIDDEAAALMKASGCRGVYLGLESATDAILSNMNKKATTAEFARGVALLNKHGIDSLAAFVLGFPGETQKTLDEVVSFIQNNGITYYSLKEFYYMHGTSIHGRRLEFGLEGEGNRWKHATMTSTEASEHKLDILSRVTSSVQVDPDASLWQLAYLADMGHSREEIFALHSEIDQAVKQSLGRRFDGA